MAAFSTARLDEIAAETSPEWAGTCVFVRKPGDEWVAVATAPDTVVLALGGWPGRAFEPSGWETSALGG